MLKEALAANTIGGKVDDDSRWRAAAEEVRQAQANWSRIGLVAEEVRRPLADRFQRASRRILERRVKRRSQPGSAQEGLRGQVDPVAPAGAEQNRRWRQVEHLRPARPLRLNRLLDLDQLHVEDEHALRLALPLCRPRPRESRNASSRLRPSAARPRSIRRSRGRAGTSPVRPARPSCRTACRRSSSRSNAP